GAFDKARQALEEGLKVLQPLENAGKLERTEFAEAAPDLKSRIRFCEAATSAMESLDEALKQPPDLVPELLAERCRVLAMRGQHADADASVEKLADRAKNGEDFFE